MDVARGDVVLASGPGEYGRKPRPFLVVQSDLFNEAHASLSLCPITSILTHNALFRVPVPSEVSNGLTEDSEIQVDKVQSLRRERILRRLGDLTTAQMEQVDQTLRRWLAL
jgi:mRNA interferase MazF